MKKLFLLGIVLGISFSGSAQLVNGGLDNNLVGWQTIGNGTSDTAATLGNGPSPMMITHFGTSAVPQYGMEMVQLASGGTSSISAIETFAGVSAGTIHSIQSHPYAINCTPTFGTAIKQKFYGTANSIISINALFATMEPMSNWDTTMWLVNSFIYNDFAFFTVTSATTQYAARIHDLESMWVDHTAFSPHSDNGHNYFNNWMNMQYMLPASDSFTVTIGILNAGDNTITSDLLVDNATLTNPLSIQNAIYPDANFSLYPNPANDFIRIGATSEKSFFQLFSSEGKLVKSEALEENENREIRIADLPAGIYLYQISGGKTKSGKIVVTH